ncbi:hypothetical protein DSO57_1012100 [Entomophthora muscae]|uniref:Uncharacterized protein n=1 Tax=Entomophthora muscae TaxID=34485 RepID=A0ACC2SJ40_9FUNG|nr:hypothetical protein DSO57_1012100 [Entomophthora muscae]
MVGWCGNGSFLDPCSFRIYLNGSVRFHGPLGSGVAYRSGSDLGVLRDILLPSGGRTWVQIPMGHLVIFGNSH